MENLFNHLVTTKVTPNGLYVLHATYNNYSHTNYVNFRHEQHRLQLYGFLKFDEKKGYLITPSGLHLIRECEKIVGKITNEKSKPKIPFTEWEENIVKYNELFPTGKKQGSSVYFRTSPKELFSRFKWFFLEYPEYSWDDVIFATKKYIEHHNESDDYTYMQTSKYFIKKDDKNKSTTSNLATLCYNIANGDTNDMNDGYFYFE
jgi:hypothetical protein